jgi:hypothetical protein
MEVGQANILILQLVFLEIPAAIQFSQIFVVLTFFIVPLVIAINFAQKYKHTQ